MLKQMFKFLCEDANYKEWSVLDEASLKQVYHNGYNINNFVLVVWVKVKGI